MNKSGFPRLWLAIPTVLAAFLWHGSSAGGGPPAGAGEDSDDDESLGAFTCDFGVDGDVPIDLLAPVLEIDRVIMSARPGFVQKHIPLGIDFATGDRFSGGRYLFESYGDAKAYKRWVENEFILDGVLFFDRPYFLNPECHAWSVIGAAEFADIHAVPGNQVVVRTERWLTPKKNQRPLLKALWPAVRTEAENRGLTAVQLLYSKKEQLVSLVYFADRLIPVPPYPDEPDAASLFALEGAAPLGAAFADPAWTSVFDRTHWVLTIWFPFVSGDLGEPPVWPNSPPFPAP